MRPQFHAKPGSWRMGHRKAAQVKPMSSEHLEPLMQSLASDRCSEHLAPGTRKQMTKGWHLTHQLYNQT